VIYSSYRGHGQTDRQTDGRTDIFFFADSLSMNIDKCFAVTVCF